MRHKRPETSLPSPGWADTVEGINSFCYHFYRLFGEIRKDVKRGMRKPKSGRRTVAGLSPHQQKFLSELKTRNFS